MANSNAVSITAPSCLDDFALLPNSRYKLESILDQSLPFPANGVCAILLYGLYGTGKTTLANLLPGLIETSRENPALAAKSVGQLSDTENPAVDYYACAQGQNGAHLSQQIQTRTGYVPLNACGLHFVIMDEVDNLTELAQSGFKAIMRRTEVVFIMTTNHLDKVDPGIQNRSVLVDMNVPPVASWRPLLRRVYVDAGLTPPPDSALDQVVTAGRGSARSIFTDVVMSANQAKKAGLLQVAKIANLRS